MASDLRQLSIAMAGGGWVRLKTTKDHVDVFVAALMDDRPPKGMAFNAGGTEIVVLTGHVRAWFVDLVDGDTAGETEVIP